MDVIGEEEGEIAMGLEVVKEVDMLAVRWMMVEGRGESGSGLRLDEGGDGPPRAHAGITGGRFDRPSSGGARMHWKRRQDTHCRCEEG